MTGAFQLGILLSDPEGWHARDLARAAPAAGAQIRWIDVRSLRASLGERAEEARREVRALQATPRAGDPRAAEFRDERGSLLDLDALLVRSIPAGSLEQVVFRMDALAALEAAGVPVVNPPRAIEAAVDKFLALERIARAGLPVPRTRASETASAALRDLDELGGEAVVKPLFGSGGSGMVRVGEREIAARVFHALERTGAVIYQQEFIPHPDGDLRVLVIGGEAQLAMRRRASGGGSPPEWRTNLSRGGKAAPHRLTSNEALLAVEAARAVGAEIAGVDLLPAPGGRLLVSEVNSSPGWRGLARVTGTDVAARVLEHLRGRGRS